MPDTPDLDALKSQYQKLQNDITTLQGKASATQAQIKTAEAQLAEIAKAIDGYGKAGPDMQHELDDDEKVIARKRSIAEVEIGHRKTAVDQKITEFDDALSEQAAATTAAADAATSGQCRGRAGRAGRPQEAGGVCRPQEPAEGGCRQAPGAQGPAGRNQQGRDE